MTAGEMNTFQFAYGKIAADAAPGVFAPKFSNVLPVFPGREDFAISEILRQHREVGLNSFMVSLSFHAQTTPARTLIPVLCKRFRKVREGVLAAAPEIELGVLVQSTLGHGWNGKVPLTDEKWEHVWKLERGEDARHCLLDPGFRAYALEVVASIAREKPAFLLMDDDFGIRKGECFCPLHLAEFAKATGKTRSFEEWRRFFESSPVDAPDSLKVAEVLRKTIVDAARDVRAAIDAVDPSLRCGLCACWPGWWQLDDVVHALAGKDTKPFMRVNDACYGNAQAKDLVHAFRGAQRVINQLDGIDEGIDEADTFPQNYMSESAAMFHAHLSQALLGGLVGAKLWTSEFRQPVHTGSQARYEAKLRDNLGFYARLMELAKDVKWGGVSYLVTRPRRGYAAHPFITDRGVYPDTWEMPIETAYGVPCRCDPLGTGGIVALRGNEVDAVADDDLRRLLSGKALVDSLAARKLTERGFAKLMGVSADAGDADFHFSADEAADGSWGFKCRWNESMSYLAPVADGVETLSNFCKGNAAAVGDSTPYSPSATFFQNELGGEVLVVGWDFELVYYNMFNPIRRRAYLSYIDRLQGAPIEFVSENADPALVRHGVLPDGAEIVSVNALTYDCRDEQAFRLLREPKSVCRLRGDGAWSPVKFRRVSPDALVVETPVVPLEPVVLRFTFGE